MEGLSDERDRGALQRRPARRDYAQLGDGSARASGGLGGARQAAADGARAGGRPRSSRLRKRLEDVARDRLLRRARPRRGRRRCWSTRSRRSLRPPGRRRDRAPTPPGDVRGRTWVTRGGRPRRSHRQRLADPALHRPRGALQVRSRARAYAAANGELRFDMFEAEFTHEGDHCTFEVLLRRFGLDDPRCATIGEIVHDIDLKDGKFARPEAAGLDRLVAGDRYAPQGRRGAAAGRGGGLRRPVRVQGTKTEGEVTGFRRRSGDVHDARRAVGDVGRTDGREG